MGSKDWGNFGDAMQKALKERIQTYANGVANELLSEYTKKLEAELARLVSNCAIEIHRTMSWQRLGDDLIITVKMPKDNQ